MDIDSKFQFHDQTLAVNWGQIPIKNSKLGFVINDLHRNTVAYRLFQALCFVFRLNEMSRKDGLTSILRGFKKHELVAFSENLKFKKYNINWKWAFRYQWIVEK